MPTFLNVRCLCRGLLLCSASLLLFVSAPAQAVPSAPNIDPVTIPPDTPTLGDNGAGWVLRCPVGCGAVPVSYGHGETKTVCDCDGDGAMDEVCAIWLHTSGQGATRGICKPGCPKDEMCTLYDKRFPNGAKQQVCECDTPFCAGEVTEEDDSKEEEQTFEREH